MASLTTNKKSGARRLVFLMPDGERKSIWLGKMNKKLANSIQSHVETILTARCAQMAIPLETALWLTRVSAEIREKFVHAGLIEERIESPGSRSDKLKLFLDALFASKTDIKASTKTAYNHTRRCLLNYFKADKRLGDITVADAGKWRRWLANHEKLSESTIRRRCGVARQFFNEAVDDRLLDVNPFGKMKGIGVQSNRDRDYFISREDAQAVLDACPDAEWRLIFALSRFGGLRCPSEHLGLRWGDIDFATSRMKVHSPKTEHHKGKESRVVPIFPELREYLEDCRELAGDLSRDPAELVITRYRAGSNLRTQLVRIIRRAGLNPWPKLFQNLRATRQTELAKSYPIHVACAWLGNSPRVADKHYLQVTDADFSSAILTTPGATRSAARSVAELRGIEGTRAETTLANPEKNEIPRGRQGYLVGAPRLELGTSALSGLRSNQLSYAPA